MFPQFGPHALPNSPPLAQHGFARNSNDWKVKNVEVSDDEGYSHLYNSFLPLLLILLPFLVTLALELVDSESTRKVWDHAFSLTLTNTLTYDPVNKTRFTQTLRVQNKNVVGGFYFTAAFHSYFAVNDVRDVTITPFKGVTYVDKVLTSKIRFLEIDVTKRNPNLILINHRLNLEVGLKFKQ